MKELKHKRTMNTKMFDMEDGTHRLVSRINNIHYKKPDGTLDDISCDINGGKVDKCDYGVKLMRGKVGYTGTDPSGKKIELELADANYSKPKIKGNTATYEEVTPGCDLQIVFLPTKIKVLRVLKNARAEKVATFRSLRQAGAVGELINRGVDADKRNTKLIVEEIAGSGDEKLIRQTFTGEVMDIDPTTRKRLWINKPTYPITIDPTSTFSISANAQDGQVSFGLLSALYPNYNYNKIFSLASIIFSGGYFRFNVTGISQGSTVNAATLKLYTTDNNVHNTLKVWAENASDAASMTTKTTAVPRFGTPTTIGSPVTTTSLNGTGQRNQIGSYALSNINVTNMVQLLVTAYDYTSAHMLFAGVTQGVATGQAPGIYNRDWGTSKDAELVIDFTAPTSPFMSTWGGYWGPL